MEADGVIEIERSGAGWPLTLPAAATRNRPRVMMPAGPGVGVQLDPSLTRA